MGLTSLKDINERWRLQGHPHANQDEPPEGDYHLFCPRCLQRPELDPLIPRTLMAVMNEAIAHKNSCPQVDSAGR